MQEIFFRLFFSLKKNSIILLLFQLFKLLKFFLHLFRYIR